MRIHQDSISELHSRLQIEEVVGEYVRLKRRGKDLWGLCPFHHEKTPSFSVVPRLGFYKCFGCDAKGDAIKFIIEHHRVSYVEALHVLADKYGVVLKKDARQGLSAEEQGEEEALYGLLGDVTSYFQEMLQQADGKGSPQAYLAERGMSKELIERFGLGYSANEWQGLYTYTKERGYDVELVRKAGLVTSKEGRAYDLFRGRVMFPIHNLAGLVIGFGGRRLRDGSGPKYINSPETLVYRKSHVLYGLYQAKRFIREQGFCYLVEGYTDVLALHSVGLGHVVASSGTSLTSSQVRLLARFTKEVSILFDSDTAGSAATLRSIDLFVAEGFNVKVVSLPIGEDPASYIEQGDRQVFLDYLKEGVEDFIKFKVKAVLKIDKEDISGRHRAIKSILETLVLVPDSVKRTLYTERCSELLGLPLSRLEEDIVRLKGKGSDVGVVVKQKPNLPKLPIEIDMLYILLRYGSYEMEGGKRLGSYLMKELKGDFFSSIRYKRLFEAYKVAWELNGELDAKAFLQGESSEEVCGVGIDVLSRSYVLGAWDRYYNVEVPQEEEGVEEWCMRTLQRLKCFYFQRLLGECRRAISMASSEEEVTRLIGEYQRIQKELKDVARELGIVVRMV